VIHPAGPVVSALLALAEHRPISGRDFLTSMVVGIEAECRIGNAVYPAHYPARDAWAAVVPADRLFVFELPCGHFDLLRSPHVDSLIRKTLDILGSSSV